MGAGPQVWGRNMNQQEMAQRVAHDVSVAAAKIAPPAALMFFGLTLNEWVAVATIVYLVLQIGYLVWKWRREMRRKSAA